MSFSITPKIANPKVKVTTDKKARLKALNALITGVQKSATVVESYLPSVLDLALDSNVWSWPRQTVRQNGSVAGRTRDIVDTGELKKSLVINTSFLKTATKFEIKYTAKYAGLVHEGGYIRPYGNTRAAKVFVPGRPWIEAAMKGTIPGIETANLESIYLEEIAKHW